MDDGDWIQWAGQIIVGPAGPPVAVCGDCQHPPGMADHYLICDCETCDVPSDERGLVGEMRRRAGDPEWWR
jgi:hypothetical protein